LHFFKRLRDFGLELGQRCLRLHLLQLGEAVALLQLFLAGLDRALLPGHLVPHPLGVQP
jgi:hypothetical protein